MPMGKGGRYITNMHGNGIGLGSNIQSFVWMENFFRILASMWETKSKCPTSKTELSFVGFLSNSFFERQKKSPLHNATGFFLNLNYF